MMLTAETQERLQALIQTYVERIEDLRLWEDISSGWQQRIRRALQIPSGDTPWAACDATIFLSGRIGFALTPRGIYWRTPWFARVADHGFLSWQDFATLPAESIQPHPEDENLLNLGKQAFLFCQSQDRPEVQALAQNIWQILQEQKVTVLPGKIADEKTLEEAFQPSLILESQEPPGEMTRLVQCAYCGRVWPKWTPTCPACGAPLPLPEARRRQMEEELYQVVLQYLPKIGHLKLWEALGARNQAVARKAFQLPEEVTPWALYDTTFWGSAKRGFVLAPTGIYWSNPGYVSPKGAGFLSWEHAVQAWRYFPPRVSEEDESRVQLSKKIALEAWMEDEAPGIVEMFRALFSVLSQYL